MNLFFIYTNLICFSIFNNTGLFSYIHYILKKLKHALNHSGNSFQSLYFVLFQYQLLIFFLIRSLFLKSITQFFIFPFIPQCYHLEKLTTPTD